MSAERIVALPTYDVTIAADALDRLGEIVRGTAPAHRYALITDSNVGPLHAARARRARDDERVSTVTIPAGEAHKTRESWASLTDEMLAAGFGRDSAVVALGGGVVGDLAGFVAATFMRGIPFVQVPTTLLAVIDASVGGKTGVDTRAGKNLVGAFHQPAAVVADIALLATLPVEHFRSGLAEAIKHGVIADAGYFDRVCALGSRIESLHHGGDDLLDVVSRSVEIKADVVRRDERESGVRKTLNFGHTIGHAVEHCSGYALLHGCAVAVGMVYESALGEQLGVTAPGTAERVRDAVRAAGLPHARPASIAADEIVAATHGDKKARGGKAEYALPSRIGAMAGAEHGWSLPIADETVLGALA
ncbi:MAG TPA: 3-dehydroquinate synthase [Gemmatimonadaceae bacterium]|nr:3-dehydroquinate synthase [Gemmatimonadaceae bacterium]